MVPFALTVVDVGAVGRAVATDPAAEGVSISLEFLFPTPLLDLWSFVDRPDQPVAAHPGTTGIGSGRTDVTVEFPFETVAVPIEAVGAALVASVAVLLLVYGLLTAVVAAGYLGGIDRRLHDEPASILFCIVEYTPRLFLYYLVLFGAFLVVLPFVLLAPPLLVLAFPAVLVLGYLFYAAPFLLVVDDTGLVEAFRRSFGFATQGGPYFGFAVWHVAVAALASLVLSVAVSTGGVGFLVALGVAAVLSLVLTAATVSFVQELVERDGTPPVTGDGSSSDHEW